MHFQWGQKFLPCFVGDFSILAPPSMGVLCWDIFLTHFFFPTFFSVFVFFDQNPFIRGGTQILLNVALSWWFIFGLLFFPAFATLFQIGPKVWQTSTQTFLYDIVLMYWSQIYKSLVYKSWDNSRSDDLSLQYLSTQRRRVPAELLFLVWFPLFSTFLHVSRGEPTPNVSIFSPIFAGFSAGVQFLHHF